jgi:predicted lipoprotein with Yx(FWY)xxD motif
MQRTTSALLTRRERGRRARVMAVVCAGVLAFGLYGLSGTAEAKEQPTVSVGKVKGVGNVLVDSSKHTLYTLVNNHQPVDCTGACLTMGFVPLTIKSGTKPTAGKGVKGLGVAAGGTQVTENGFPLFLFSTDKVHQAQGQGMMSSGGTWHAPTVKVAKSKKGGGGNAGTGGVSF